MTGDRKVRLVLSSQSLDQQLNCSDKQVIHKLYEKMAAPASWKAFSIVRRKDIAHEIVQDVFIKLWQSGGIFPNEKAVYAWIYKACHRAAIDHVRSATFRRESYVDTYADEAREGAKTQEDNLLDREAVIECTKNLSAEEAEIFIYAEVDRLTQVEIAELTGKSRRTIQRISAKIEESFKRARKDHDN
jgi:RNA polymerase sigma-70 factor (ECF subfamily)